MDLFLRFKEPRHTQDFSQSISLQLNKRYAISMLYALCYCPFVIAITFAGSSLPSEGTVILLICRLVFVAIFVAGVCCLRKRPNISKRSFLLCSYLLDLIVIGISFSFYPLTSIAKIDDFGELGLLCWGWAIGSMFFSGMCCVGDLWLRMIGCLAQITYFSGFLIANQKGLAQSIMRLVQAFLLLCLVFYIWEKFEKIRYLEKQRVQDDSEAIKKIIDDSIEGILLADSEDRVIYANSRVIEMLDVDKELSLVNVLSVIKPRLVHLGSKTTEKLTLAKDLRESTLYDIWKEVTDYLFSSKSQIFVEGHKTRKQDQQDRNYHIKLTSSKYMDRQVIVFHISDTTDRDALVTAQESSFFKDRLLASVSHELRTPLNGSINFIEQVIETPSVPETVKEKYLLPAIRSNRLLLLLINDILDFSQMQENKLRLFPEYKSLTETSKECLELIEIQALKKGLDLKFENTLPKDKQYFLTDHNRLKQVILNLLSNSLKFTFQGSIVLKIEETPNIQQGERSSVRISCKDSGIGISAENQKKLFIAFEKIDLGQMQGLNTAGVGLGLHISNNLVSRLNSNALGHPENASSIKFHSDVGKGSTFYFELYYPHDTDQSATHYIRPSALIFSNNVSLDYPPEEESSAHPLLDIRSRSQSLNPGFHHRTSSQFKTSMSPQSDSVSCVCPPILIVDDDIFNLTALEQNLTKLRISCKWATNGQIALDAILERQANKCCSKCEQFKVVFLDCNMPVMDGFETTSIIRKKILSNEVDDLKIIACTAFVQPAELDRALRVGMDDYCIKPISVQMIRTKLRAVGYRLNA